MDRRDAVAMNWDLVRGRREELGMSQQALASAIGLTRGYISGIENGKHPRVSRDTAKALAKALLIDVDGLISEPSAAEDFLFPDVSDELEVTFVVDEVRRLLQDPRASSQRQETILLLRSFLAWLRFREDHPPRTGGSL